MRTKNIISVILTAAVIFASCGKQENVSTSLTTENDSISYAIGVTFGNSLIMSGLEEVNAKAIAMAIHQIYQGDDTSITPEEANIMLNDYFSRLQFGDNLQEGLDFLAENMLRDDVYITESGIQYEIIESGSGPRPSADDEVVVHYEGTLLDGTVFDSSYQRDEPSQFRLDRVIPGWTEALQLMPVGSKWKIYIPQELAYGANPRQGGPIQPYSMLIFDVELMEIVSGQ